jgi:hypothetical protein
MPDVDSAEKTVSTALDRARILALTICVLEGGMEDDLSRLDTAVKNLDRGQPIVDFAWAFATGGLTQDRLVAAPVSWQDAVSRIHPL